MPRPKTDKSVRADEINSRRQALWDQATHRRKVADHLVRNWDVDMECPHDHLAGDPWPHRCDCFEAHVNTTSETLLKELRELRAEVKTLKQMVGGLRRDVTAVGLQVSKAGDNGR